MSEQPNILIIMCDQLTPRRLGCYGGPVPTPNLGKLAAKGVLFTQATCPTPICSPSRASMVTGLVPHTHGITHNVNRREYPAIPSPPTEEGIKAKDITMGRLLNAEGYQTHHYGKWHLLDENLSYYPDMYGEHLEYTREMAAVFREVRSRPSGLWMDWYGWALPVEVSPVLKDAIVSLGDRWQEERHREFIAKMGKLKLPVEKTFDFQVAERTIERLRNLEENPFMITCSFNSPHDPNVLPSPYYEEFAPEAIALPENFGSRESRFEKEWSRRIVADLGTDSAKEFLRIYYGSIRFIDDLTGRILDALDETGRAENTIVVFTADHGDMAGAHGMIWKSTLSFYEDVVRVPLIIRYPDKIKSSRIDPAVCITDIMPTLLELAEQPIPAQVQGISLVPCLRGCGRNTGPVYTFCERLKPDQRRTRTIAPGAIDTGAFMVRGNGWKYCRYPEGEEFLYNLIEDPEEVINLARDSRHEACGKELSSKLDAWLKTDNPKIIQELRNNRSS